MNDFVEFFLPLILFIAVVFGAATGLVYVSGAYSCGQYQQVTGKDTRYAGMECYIKDNGQWFAWTEYKNRLVTKGDLK